MPPGMVAPYQVKLDSGELLASPQNERPPAPPPLLSPRTDAPALGELIWAPEDVNNLIRKG